MASPFARPLGVPLIKPTWVRLTAPAPGGGLVDPLDGVGALMHLAPSNIAGKVAMTSAVKYVIGQDGQLAIVAANTPAIDYSAGRARWLLECAQTNKVTCQKHNVTATTNVTKTGDAAATLTIVDDAARLALLGLDRLCTNGRVYRLNNLAGVAAASVSIGGQVGNTNKHSASVWVRTAGVDDYSTGYASLYVGSQATPLQSAPDYTRIKKENVTPGTTTQTMLLRAEAGCDLYFVLPQLEEASGASSEIPGATTGTSSRVTDIASFAAVPITALRLAARITALASATVLAGDADALLAVNAAGTGIDADLSTGSVMALGGAVPGENGVCFGWGPSGRRGSANEAAAVASATVADSTHNTIYFGGPAGIPAGMRLHVDEVMAWALPDRPSAEGVVKYAKAPANPASVLENNFTISGDSTAAGAGVLTGAEKWATLLCNSYTPPRSNYNGGAPGSTTATQRTNFTNQPLYRNRTFIQMDWPNAGETVQGWTDNVQAMIDLLGHNHYLVVAAIRKTDGTEDPGTTRGDFMTSLNNAIAAKWPSNFVDYNAALASPSTRTDHLHRNAAGHQLEAAQIRAWLDGKGW